jgi:hypothetical protein
MLADSAGGCRPEQELRLELLQVSKVFVVETSLLCSACACVRESWRGVFSLEAGHSIFNQHVDTSRTR